MKQITILSSLLFLCIASAYPRQFPGTYTDLNDENLPSDFIFQGEYEGSGYGAQVISLDKGFFHIVVYQGGLPGEGWNGTDRSLLDGKIHKQGVSIKTADGKRKYLAANPEEFSATRKFPPIGHKAFSGSIDGKRMQLLGTGNRNLILNKITRKSPTLEKKAPRNALVLFDGTNKNNWEGGRLDQKTKLLNTDGKIFAQRKNFLTIIYISNFFYLTDQEQGGKVEEIVAYTTLTCMKIKFWILLDWKVLTMNVEVFTP